MNRRMLLASSLSFATVLRQAYANWTVTVPPHPVDFLRREFLTRTSDVPGDQARDLRASAFDFASADDAAAAIEILKATAQDSMGFEISIGPATPIASLEPQPELPGWFVTYATRAGAAGFYQAHAHGIFALEARVFEIVVSGEDPDVLIGMLDDQIDLILGRTGSLAAVLPTADDVPQNLELFQEQTPEGSFDAKGDRRDDDSFPWWPNPMK